MATSIVLRRLEARAVSAEQMISFLKKEISDIKQFCSSRGEQEQARQLEEENRKLAAEIEQCRQKLINLETAHGKTQIPLPSHNALPTVVGEAIKPPRQAATHNKGQAPGAPPQAEKPRAEKNKEGGAENAAAAGGKAKKQKKPQPAKLPEKADDDVTRLDLRVGLITTAVRHPDADTLYVETVEVGAETPLTVVSGLAGRIPLEQMQNRPVVLLCNLKPAKMRGIVSQAMVMCASAPGGQVEVLLPPSGSVPGDRVTLEGQEASPPDTQLKAKVWEAVAAKLRTRADLVAAFDGVTLAVPGKGAVTTASLAEVPIK